MNTQKYMIIIKDEIKTSDISRCNYNSETKKWDVTFQNGKIYSYAYSNVERLKEPKVLNRNMYRIHKGSHELFDIKAIYVFQGAVCEYWHICFEDGSERDYRRDELTVEESCLNQKQAEDVFAYIRQLAGLNDLKNEETGENLLVKKFDKIKHIGNDVALAKYLNPEPHSKEDNQKEYVPIFPFGCNNSQYKAVKAAMENQVSVIQGPPGTGKTQTILNIIANILLQGKTVQVVSNNNSATENVYEKLSSEKYNLGFIVAALGNADNKKSFIDAQNASYPDFTKWKQQEEGGVSLHDIRQKSSQLKERFDRQEELARLRQEKSQLETELEYFILYLEGMAVQEDGIRAKRKMAASDWMALWQECQILSDDNLQIGFWFKLKNLLQYRITNFNFYKQDVSRIIATFQSKFYQAKEAELSRQISELETYLEGGCDDLLKEMCDQSMILLKDCLAKKYADRESRIVFTAEDLWKNPQKVLAEYPVILSTTFSARNSLHTDVIYDYLIMDEASQVDVATGALALSCARNAVIVGDTKQLPNVVTEEIGKQAKAVFDSFHIHKGYQYTKSFLQSVLDVMPAVTQTMLREHYRCHPKIINFCNQKFYRGELIIMTKDHGEEDVLGVVKTAPGNHVRDHYSQRQIDVIRHEILPKYVTDKAETGIIAPYKNQVEALEKEFQDIDAATVHKFQGKEKDTIIISTVDDEITDFADDPYLINVAVSRAKKKLLLVVSGNEQTKERNITDLIAYVQYHNFEVMESKVYSIFDYLYKQYSEERIRYLEKRQKISDYDSENLMYGLIEEILDMDSFACLDVVCHFPMNMLIKDFSLLEDQERLYAMCSGTHLDFLLFNRISKKPVLVIEVDGYEFHKDGTEQALRDQMKDRILEKYEIPQLRFKTNGSLEKERILEKLGEIME